MEGPEVDFINQANDSGCYCPYFWRYGICMEPVACNLKHLNVKMEHVDIEEFGISQDYMYVEEKKDCTCCHGMINNCNGEVC